MNQIRPPSTQFLRLTGNHLVTNQRPVVILCLIQEVKFPPGNPAMVSTIQGPQRTIVHQDGVSGSAFQEENIFRHFQLLTRRNGETFRLRNIVRIKGNRETQSRKITAGGTVKRLQRPRTVFRIGHQAL